MKCVSYFLKNEQYLAASRSFDLQLRSNLRFPFSKKERISFVTSLEVQRSLSGPRLIALLLFVSVCLFWFFSMRNLTRGVHKGEKFQLRRRQVGTRGLRCSLAFQEVFLASLSPMSRTRTYLFYHWWGDLLRSVRFIMV